MNNPNHIKKFFLCISFLVIVCLLTSGKALAQTLLVILEGTVTDEEGRALPGAALTLRNVETGYVLSTTTRSDGRYIISGIRPGKYECEVNLTGFGTHLRRGVTFSIGARLTIDFTLKLVTIEEMITVTAESPMVEVTKSEIGSVVSRDKIDDLPLYNRGFGDLQIMKAGVQYGRANAQPRGSGETIVDGVSIEWVGTGSLRTTIAADAIQEFRIITTNFRQNSEMQADW